MSVINSEYARNIGLNGRVAKKHIEVILLPGLNTVSKEQMEMLRQNDAFEHHIAMQKMSVIEHSDKDELEEPKNIEDIDITSMSVPKAGVVINSVATLELLDKFEGQEQSGESRKGILGIIAKQRDVVQDILDKQERGKAAGE